MRKEEPTMQGDQMNLCHEKKYFYLDNFSPISIIQAYVTKKVFFFGQLFVLMNQVSFGAHLEGEVLGLVFSLDFKWQQ